MKSTIRKDTFRMIYEMLDSVSPVDYDCGKLCGAICCTCDKDNDSNVYDMGIYLLPGEDKLFTKDEDWIRWNYEMAEEYEYPDSWHGKVYFIRCKNPPACDRKLRPIQCRTYPLTPHIDGEGNLKLIYNVGELPYECPLIRDRIKLNQDFIEKTYEAWRILIEDQYIYDLVSMDSELRYENQLKFEVVF